jgi:hypothetical protein
MSLTIPPQCFAIFIVLFGFIGFLQGWRRAVVLMGFTLSAILFLTVGLGNFFATIIFVRIPQTINTLTAGALFSSSMPPPNAQEVLITKLIVLGVAMLLGFIIGGRAFKATAQTFERFIGIIPGLIIIGGRAFKATAQTFERFIGIIPGLITGYALISYLGSLFAANQTISVGVTTPASSALSNSTVILALVIIAVVAIVIGLLTTRLGK